MSDKELMQEALKWQEHIKVLANEHAEDELYQKRSKVLDWLIEQAKKMNAQSYVIRKQHEEIKQLREALEFYANGNHYTDKMYHDKIILLDDGEIARKVLEGTE